MGPEQESRVAVATRGNQALRGVLEELYAMVEGKAAEAPAEANGELAELKESIDGRFDRVQRRLRALEGNNEE